METLIKIQKELKAPKNQYNSFGKYKYRSCEDILEAVKPLCCENSALVTLSDDVREIGGKLFVMATATFTHGEFTKSVTSLAMHPEEKRGMDGSQITGAASSYARKYALNGLFLIDDTKDADATNNHKDEPKSDQKDAYNEAMTLLEQADSVAGVKAIWESYTDLHKDKEFIKAVTVAKNKFK